MVFCSHFWKCFSSNHYTAYFNDYFMADTSDSGSGNASFCSNSGHHTDMDEKESR